MVVGQDLASMSMKRTLANHGAGNTFIASLSPCLAHIFATTTFLLGEGDGQLLLAQVAASDLCVTGSLSGVCVDKEKILLSIHVMGFIVY